MCSKIKIRCEPVSTTHNHNHVFRHNTMRRNAFNNSVTLLYRELAYIGTNDLAQFLKLDEDKINLGLSLSLFLSLPLINMKFSFMRRL